MTAVPLAALIVLKLLASLVSLGSGFRGGLFFASLFVGALLGKLYALALPMVFPGLDLDTSACIFAGMATLAVAIVGGPLTMTFLVLESTGDLPVAGAVLAACDRHQPDGAGDVRLFVFDVAAASARRVDPRRARRRLDPRTDGGGADGARAKSWARRGEPCRILRRASPGRGALHRA